MRANRGRKRTGGGDRGRRLAIGSKRERGQTSFDFLVGVSVFLLTAGFVLATLSGMVDPFVGGQEKTLVADRATTLLAGGMLAGNGPSVLNETCTYGFFNASYAPKNGTACSVGFAANESDVAARLDLDDRYSVNVTVRRADGGGDLVVRCTDGDGLRPCPGETRLADGPTPPSGRSIVTAQRAVFLDGRDVILEVRVW